VDTLTETIFAKRDENRFLAITLRSGKKEVLHRGDLLSGAIIASIVERAKGTAIKRAISSGLEEGISEADLRLAFDSEYANNDIFPPSDITEDWLQLIDYDSENVVKVAPFRPGSESKRAPSAVI
jgi:proteasome-associated ATPase